MTIRAAIYARSSPECPFSNEDQIERLQTVADERGWTVAKVFADRPVSAKMCLDRRPGELALIDAIRSGTLDRVLVSSICRIGKSLMELVSFMETCGANSVSIYLDQQRVDTETCNGPSLLDLAGMMALHVRQTRRDRIRRGQAAARALSIRFGRPPIAAAKVEKAKQELLAGKGVREAARLAGISAASASRINSAMNSKVASV